MEHRGGEHRVGPEVVRLADPLGFRPHRQQLATPDQERLQGHLEAVVQHAAEPGMMVSPRCRKALHELGISSQNSQHELPIMFGWQRCDRRDLVQHLLAMRRLQQHRRRLKSDEPF